jgi:hypothetical protein
MKYRFINKALFVLLLVATTACDKTVETITKNDLLKKSVGPNVVNQTIEFAYAMAVPGGKIVSAQVEASIPGASKTGFGLDSYYTNSGGVDIPVRVAKDTATIGNKSSVVIIDTCAATLRFYYVIPEAARGKTLSFKFSCTANNGETVSYTTPEYVISKMDIQRNTILTSGNTCYFSLKQMKAFTKAEVDASPDLANEIDLVYYYQTAIGIAHVLASPATSADYLYGTTIPNSCENESKISRRRDVRDLQLGSIKAEFVDDLDFEGLNMDNTPNFIFNLIKDNSLFVVSKDGKYKAFILINSTDNTNKKLTISIKRYSL